MENNKAYLQRIHWVFLVAVPAAVLFSYAGYWLGEFKSTESSFYFYLLRNFIPGLFFYLALGVCTNKWKATAIAFGLYAAACAMEAYALNPGKFDLPASILIFFFNNVPIVLFLLIAYGWDRKLATCYLFAMVLSYVLFSGFYTAQGLGQQVEGFIHISPKAEQVITVFTGTASLVCGVIFMCELMNYMQGKTVGNKTRLLNLGNDYDPLQTWISFWSLKTLIWITLIGCAQQIGNYTMYFRSSFMGDSDINKYMLFITLVTLLTGICAAMLLGWYLRKFMIESMITYNSDSKFLYWFSLLPVVGIFAFIISQFDSKKQVKHSDKVASIGQFAASSTTSVTAVFFILLCARLFFRLISGDATYLVISLFISVLLFAWMINHRLGFYVNMLLNLALLAGGMIVLFTTEIRAAGIGLLFGLVLLNLTHLVLLYPVYHFHDFEYIPAEDPDKADNKEFHLFDTP